MIKINETGKQELPKQMPSLLLTWYDKNARILPWRENPLPYHVWISEIMLQQTRVEAVKPYFERFLELFPTIESLADADDELLLKSWEGLGYYNRVRNIKKAAGVMVHEFGAKVPCSYDGILGLPGIGEYTAGAISSIAYGIPVPAVDGNVLRVYSRICGSFEDITLQKMKDKVRDEIKVLIPIKRAGDFNQALMELGATVCLPNGAPLCNACPLSEICIAKKENLQSEIPVKTPKKNRVIDNRAVFLILFGDRVALRRRENKGLLGGMWEFPSEKEGSPEALLEGWGILADSVKSLYEAKHIFTHVEWHMKGYLVEVSEGRLPEDWIWASEKEVTETFALPNAFKEYKKILQKIWEETV